MKKVVTFFVFVLLFVGSGTSQVLRSIDFTAPDEYQDRASTWLTWANNTDLYHMIGFEGTTEFYAMHRFTESDLSPYAGQQLTKIRFLPSSHSSEPTSASYTVVVYTGGYYSSSILLSWLNDPGTLVCSQVVNNVTYGIWNTVTLSSPVTIDASEELWIGVYVTAYAGYPMSHDDATAVSGKGDIMGYDGDWGVPDDFFSSADVHNWNIAGLVTNGGADESYIDLSVRFINNGTDQEDITSMNVPAGQPFRPVIAVHNASSIQASLDYNDTTTITGYMDNEQISTHHLSSNNIQSGHGVWLQITELSAADIFAQGYCGSTHTFCYEVSATEGWTDFDLANNRDCITVTFGEYSTLYHITVLNDDSTVSPDGVVEVYPGGTQRFVITPPEGMQIAQALADGTDVTANVHTVAGVGKTYTFNNVHSDHTFQVLYEEATSIGDRTLPEVSLYPNPAGSHLTVTCGKTAHCLSIYDCSGRMVKSCTTPSDTFEIDVNDLHTGIYFAKFLFDNQIITKKFVKM